MANYAIELNDAGIVAANVEGEIVGPSPGYAHMDGSALLVGLPAMSRSRLNPRRSLNTFWDGLGTDPLSRPFPEQLTQADLAHRHLQEFVTDLSEWQGEEPPPRVLLAIPGSFLTWQLGLLLGISRSAGLAVKGLVDSAVAAAVGQAPGGSVLHLDVQLHRVVWTELDTSAGVSRRRVEENGSVGWVGLVDAWAKDIAAQFLRATRFDPLHNAASEQDLYNEIPGWLQTLNRSEVVGIGLSYAGRDYAIDVAKSRLVTAIEEPLNRIVDLAAALMASVDKPKILLTSRAGAIPGLKSRLARIAGSRPDVLAVGAAAVGALTCESQIEVDEEELPFVVSLAEPHLDREPGGRVIEPSAEDEGARPSRLPTHLVYGGLAYPIGSEPFWLGTALAADQPGLNVSGNTAGISRSHCHIRRVDNRVVVEDCSTYGTYLSDRPVNGTGVAAVGDSLRIGSPGVEIQLIAVLDSDG